MYRLLKEHGAGKNVVLENISTSATLVIGGVTTKLIDMLVHDGKDIDLTDRTFITQEWDFSVSDECAREITGLAFTMRKPIRDQRKVVTQKEQKPSSNKQIDAMDVLLGLANYM